MVRIALDPSSWAMAPGQERTVQATGFYDNETSQPIPPWELSWKVDDDDGGRQVPNGGDGEQQIPNVVSVDRSTGTVTANRPGQATLIASTQGVEESADIIVTDNPGDPGGFQGPGNLENPNSTPPTTTTPPNPVVG